MQEHQKKSFFTVFSVLLIMVAIGVILAYSQSGITGFVVANSVACASNADCDDGISCTIDSCKNAGETGAFCASQPVSYCQSGDGCCPAGCKNSDADC